MAAPFRYDNRGDPQREIRKATDRTTPKSRHQRGCHREKRGILHLPGSIMILERKYSYQSEWLTMSRSMEDSQRCLELDGRTKSISTKRSECGFHVSHVQQASRWKRWRRQPLAAVARGFDSRFGPLRLERGVGTAIDWLRKIWVPDEYRKGVLSFDVLAVVEGATGLKGGLPRN